MMNDTEKVERYNSLTKQVSIGVLCFVTGVISHGALDYIPHCYPVNSKIDVVISSLLIMIITLLAKSKYRIIVGLTFLGCIFPDIIDLSPAILNKYVGLNLPIHRNVFPWHLHIYSGSIYSDNCGVSTFNHYLTVLVVLIICWTRQKDLKLMILGS